MRILLAIASGVMIAGSAPTMAAQVSGAPRAPADSVRLNRPLFVRSDLYILGMFSAATVGMFPLDKHLASLVRDEDLVANRDLKRASSVIRFFGGPGPFIIGGGMYVVGRYAHVARVAELAVHGTEGIVVGLAVSGVLKDALGRGRPYVSVDTNPRSFGFLRGFRGTDFSSFPSGHTTAAFAAAAAVSAETSEWWPRSRWIIGSIVYGGATLVGLSRMYDDKHWASDVVMGAAIGVFSGIKTVRFNHTHAGNRIDRWLLGGAAESAHLLPSVGGDGRSLGLAANLTW
ncbi:MAG TPA: phosphatase PAP2 family protein [Gemmatimonadaceae bacterium]|jgi:membrane-associated phospholipid phosphatase